MKHIAHISNSNDKGIITELSMLFSRFGIVLIRLAREEERMKIYNCCSLLMTIAPRSSLYLRYRRWQHSCSCYRWISLLSRGYAVPSDLGQQKGPRDKLAYRSSAPSFHANAACRPEVKKDIPRIDTSHIPISLAVMKGGKWVNERLVLLTAQYWSSTTRSQYPSSLAYSITFFPSNSSISSRGSTTPRRRRFITAQVFPSLVTSQLCKSMLRFFKDCTTNGCGRWYAGERSDRPLGLKLGVVEPRRSTNCT